MTKTSATTHLPALHDALDGATAAAFAAETGDKERVDQALLDASAAAVSAFPAGSREADALIVIITAIGRAAEHASVPRGQFFEPELGD